MSYPAKLQRIVDLFASAPKEIRIQALLDYSNRVPPLPPRYAENRDSLEQVHECQSPFFLATEVDKDGAVTMFFESPLEAPTVRGYAGILAEGLNGEQATTILELPNDFYYGIGLEDIVTPQRLRGMGAIVARLKRQISDQLELPSGAAPSRPSEEAE
ncbi:MAG: SufE family protein [Acidimicrobiia bacterium]|nr:SufE family protein [Acidimicrobiia bacterium]